MWVGLGDRQSLSNAQDHAMYSEYLIRNEGEGAENQIIKLSLQKSPNVVKVYMLINPK